MKIELNDNSFWLSVWSMVGICIVAIVITVGIYSNNANKLILKADTCEKAAMISGNGYNQELMACGLIGKK